MYNVSIYSGLFPVNFDFEIKFTEMYSCLIYCYFAAPHIIIFNREKFLNNISFHNS